MESELVDEPDQKQAGERTKPLSYSEQFRELCGWYLSLGMSYSDYWDGDPEMPVHYREKNRRDTERRNYEMWLQGEYIYEAIIEASPVYNFFASKNKREPIPYRSEPIPLTRIEQEQKEERANKRKMAAGKEIMMGLMQSNNARFRKKEAENDSQIRNTGIPDPGREQHRSTGR